jgi:N-methylhydantoinase A
VAGIVGAAMLAKAAGYPDVITFDMGGTSSDISLVVRGEPTVTTRGKLAGYPILLPVIDLVTIGAGGGSIAQIDAGGGLRVGPRSAGSVPGPMCYGQNGIDPTMTDANLLCGRLNAEYFLAGARRIYPELAAAGIAQRIAAPLQLDAIDAALGIIDIAEAHMVNAIKLVSVERGLDPRGFTLVGFGGAGPLHVASLADAIGIRSVLVPPAPGNTSASGLLCAEVRQDLVRTLVCPLNGIDSSVVTRLAEDLIQQAAELLAQEDVPPAEQQVVLSADLRYVGQSHELSIPLAVADLAEAGLQNLNQRFQNQHSGIFGYALAEHAVELVNLRATALGSSPALPWPRHSGQGSTAATPIGSRRVHFRGAPEREWPVYRFDQLQVGAQFDGPAIVEYRGSTLVVPPHWDARYDSWLNAVLTHR